MTASVFIHYFTLVAVMWTAGGGGGGGGGGEDYTVAQLLNHWLPKLLLE